METGLTGERVIVPLAEEIATVHKTARVSGAVRVRKTVEETLQDIDETVKVQDVTVRRVPIGRWIDQAPPQRQEGDTTVIPIVEEVAVIETRLRLVEEIRVTRSDAIRRFKTAVPVRREQAVVEEVSADGTVTRPDHPPPSRPESPTDRSAIPPNTAAATAARRPTTPRRIPMTTIIGLFTDPTAASRAQEAIREPAGKQAGIHLYGTGADRSADELRVTLSGLEIDDTDVRVLTGALDRGAWIVSALVPPDRADAIVALLLEHGAEGTDAYGGPEDDDTEILEEVEETLDVAKTQVESGIRAQATVTERPVQKTVTLRDEIVQAHRRPVDRDLSPDEAEAAFQERTVEVTGVSEEAEIRKAARLIGEVEITKASHERTETIRDTLRKTEVETQKIGPRR